MKLIPRNMETLCFVGKENAYSSLTVSFYICSKGKYNQFLNGFCNAEYLTKLFTL